MVDPPSISSSVVGLATAGVILTSSLYNLCEIAGWSQDEIEGIAYDVSLFEVVADELGKILSGPLPRSIHSDKLEASLSGVVARCEIIYRHVFSVTELNLDLPEAQLPQQLALAFKRVNVNEIRATLESLKLTMSLVLRTLRLFMDKYVVA